MKKILLLVVALMTVIGVEAQSLNVGADLSYSSKVSNVGLGAKVQFDIPSPIRVEAGFDYYFDHNHLSMWDLTCNLQYVIGLVPRAHVYPLVGIGYNHWSFDPGSEERISLNVGLGLEFAIASRISLAVEGKCPIQKDFTGMIFGMGVRYKI